VKALSILLTKQYVLAKRQVFSFAVPYITA
jgi:hypothetical protein